MGKSFSGPLLSCSRVVLPVGEYCACIFLSYCATTLNKNTALTYIQYKGQGLQDGKARKKRSIYNLEMKTCLIKCMYLHWGKKTHVEKNPIAVFGFAILPSSPLIVTHYQLEMVISLYVRDRKCLFDRIYLLWTVFLP